MSRFDPGTLLRPPQLVAAGRVVSTIQKFLPEEKGNRHPVLSDRRNIVVIAEAHSVSCLARL
jgi:type I restriction enzyme, R subunit